MERLILSTAIALSLFLSGHAYAIFDVDGKFEENWDFDWIGSDEVPARRWTMWPNGSYQPKNGEYSQTTPDARNPLSSGRNGLRVWYPDSTADSPGPSSSAPASPYLSFGSPQRELWVRWYMRYQEGFRWWQGGGPNYDKLWRLWTHTHGGDPNVMGHLGSGDRIGVAIEYSVSGSQYAPNAGWQSTFTDNGSTSHGRWIAFEMHIKMESAPYATDGELRVWLNGDLVVQNTGMTFVNPDATTQGTPEAQLDGWVHMHISNQDYVQNAIGPIGRNVAYVDWDDIVLYNQTPPNADAHGNPFIGPIDLDPGPSAPQLTILSPEDGALLAVPEVIVEGRVEPARPDTAVSVNGDSATYIDGAFTATVSLVPGDNHIVAVAIDKEGREGASFITVVFEQEEEDPSEDQDDTDEEEQGVPDVVTAGGCRCSADATRRPLGTLFAMTMLLLLAARIRRRGAKGV